MTPTEIGVLEQMLNNSETSTIHPKTKIVIGLTVDKLLFWVKEDNKLVKLMTVDNNLQEHWSPKEVREIKKEVKERLKERRWQNEDFRKKTKKSLS